MKTKLILVLSTFFSTVAMVATSDKFDFLYPGDDDAVASELMARTFQKTNLEWDVEYEDGEEIFFLQTPQRKLLVGPVTFEDSYDFVTFTYVNAARDGVSQSDKAYLSLVNDLNETFARVKFCINDDGSLRVQFSHQFRNRLSTAEVADLVESFNQIINFVINDRLDDLSPYLK